MSIYVDKKFVTLLSPRLERFKQKSEFLWNCRCPFCGDSQKNKLKARGYIYRRKNGIFFTCHNCHVGTTVGGLVKHLDPSLYQEYILESFKGNAAPNVAQPSFDELKTNTELKAKFSSNSIKLPSISSLETGHYAKEFLQKRLIPETYFTQFYFASDFKSFVDEMLPNHGKELPEGEPRIVIPFYDEKNLLLGFQGRALRKTSAKYITLKMFESARKVYGLNTVDLAKTVYVVEGPIDSLFLHNSVAMMDSALYNANQILGLNVDCVFIYDNENRNSAVVRDMRKTINLGKRICIWPKSVVDKDINDMILSGLNPAFVQDLIDRNTYSGLQANMELEVWARV